MATYQNIQTLNRRQQSKYPFDIAADLHLGTYIFPCNMIHSLRIQVTEASFPLYIGAIRYLPYADYGTQSHIRYIVKDSHGYTKAYIDLKGPDKACVRDTQGTVCGDINFSPELYKWSLQLIRGTVGGYLQLSPTNLPLSSFVLSCCSFIGFKGLSIDGQYIGQDVTLNFTQNIVPVLSTDTIRLDIFSDYYLQQNQEPQRFITVNGIDMQGKGLIVKHNTLSNLRVVTQNRKITFIGVTDAD